MLAPVSEIKVCFPIEFSATTIIFSSIVKKGEIVKYL